MRDIWVPWRAARVRGCEVVEQLMLRPEDHEARHRECVQQQDTHCKQCRVLHAPAHRACRLAGRLIDSGHGRINGVNEPHASLFERRGVLSGTLRKHAVLTGQLVADILHDTICAFFDQPADRLGREFGQSFW